jgi:hypothetical protein
MKKEEKTIFILGLLSLILMPIFVLISFLMPEIGFFQFFYYILIPLIIITLYKSKNTEKTYYVKLGMMFSKISLTIIILLILIMMIIFFPRGV